MGAFERMATDSDHVIDDASPLPTQVATLAGLERISEQFPTELVRFLSLYGFAINEVTTKLEILQAEYTHFHDRNPIEHISSRVKDPQSIIDKARRRRVGLGLDEIRDNIQDIAGIRVTCSFVSDVYVAFEALCAQADIEVIEVEDYIAEPKPNGYRSLHAIIKVPVFLTGGAEDVFVELQFRTIAMDFWASLEHTIFYKYDKQVPDLLLRELHEAAETAAHLDRRMERLHREISVLGIEPEPEPGGNGLVAS
ncbi:GTP pyrophosphokinase family protein [soil metagenome]